MGHSDRSSGGQARRWPRRTVSVLQPSVLSLLVTPEPPEGLERLLVDMRAWCVAVADEPELSAAAYVATSPLAPGLQRALASGRPVAVWVRDTAEADAARSLNATVLLSADPAMAPADDMLTVPPGFGVDVDRVTPVMPFVRTRLRRAHGLPEPLVIDLRDGRIPVDLQPSALGVCSACVVVGDADALLTALAWGAPTVTDAESAAAVGARPGVELEVADGAALLPVAVELATDDRRAARLSRAGRRLAEARGSTTRVAWILADRLRMSPSPPDLADAHIEAALNRLQTPSTSFIRRRARRALIPFRR